MFLRAINWISFLLREKLKKKYLNYRRSQTNFLISFSLQSENCEIFALHRQRYTTPSVSDWILTILCREWSFRVFEFRKSHEKYLENIWEKNRVFSYLCMRMGQRYGCVDSLFVCASLIRVTLICIAFIMNSLNYLARSQQWSRLETLRFFILKRKEFFSSLIRLETNRRNHSNTCCRGATTCKYRTVSLASYT